MCIFCGSQCGIGEFLIAIGLPFLGLYFYRIKNSLVKIYNKIFRRGAAAAEISAKPIENRDYEGLLQDYRVISPPSLAPKNLKLIEIESRSNGPTEELAGKTKSSKPLKIVIQEDIKGVRGWLLLLCLNLTIIIPASCLYDALSTLYLICSPINQIMLQVLKNLYLYNMVIVAALGFLATLSFYDGLQLWEVKPGAVKFTKIFLIIQLLLIIIIGAIRTSMTSLYGSETILGIVIKIIIPSLLHFSLWYLYLSKSRRVHNTYGEIDSHRIIISQLPA